MAAYDVGVIGLGGMGSAVAAECARRGMTVIAFEQFNPLHELGASSGRTRMIRKAYYEHSAYVPLVLRAYDAWRELEGESRTKLLYITGLLMVGNASSELLTGAMRSARDHGLPLEGLSRADLRGRFPAFTLLDQENAIYEPDGGFIVPERAIRVLYERARSAGAAMHFGKAVRVEDALEQARRVVVCAGPWLPDLGLDIPVTVERNVQHWFAPQNPTHFSIGHFPSFLVDRASFAKPLYGFPDAGDGLKAAFHGSGVRTSPATLDRAVHESDLAPVRRALDQALPGAARRHLGSKVCMYELTPDSHFVISPHPAHPRVLVAGGFSGHGFKFVPVVGRIVADQLAGIDPELDVTFLSAKRFTRSAGSLS